MGGGYPSPPRDATRGTGCYSSSAMDAFVRKLIQRLHDPAAPLSRNSALPTTFQTPEGKRALRRRRAGSKSSAAEDIVACVEEGRPATVTQSPGEGDDLRIELVLERVKGRRMAVLEADEFELLAQLPGVRESLEGASAERSNAISNASSPRLKRNTSEPSGRI